MAETTRSVLTGRERQILALIADGMSNGEIGAALYISPATAKSHVKAIFARYGVNSRAQAVAAGFRAGDLA
jgi:DNA-binding CsgD family transcriptional regulator